MDRALAAPSSYRRRRDEWHEGGIRWLVGARACWHSHSLRAPRLRPGRRTRSSRSTARSRRALKSSGSSCRRRCPPLPGRLHRAGAAENRPRPPRRFQCAGQVQRRDQPGQPALGERRPGGRSHAARAQPEVARRLPGADRRQGADRHARQRGAADGRERERRCAADTLRREPEPQPAASARHRFPSRRRWFRSRRRRAPEQPGRCRHPPAGPEPGRRVPPFQPAGQPAQAPRRHRFRHTGAGPSRRRRRATVSA